MKGLASLSQKDLFFIDQSAQYSAYQSIHDLAENGGFSLLGSQCGDYLGYALWNTPTLQCFPDYETNFKAFLNANLNQYFTDYSAVLPQNNYEFLLTPDSIIATAQAPLEYTITGGIYTIKPSFKFNMSYNINEYKKIIGDAKDLLEICSNEEALKDCVGTNKPANWIMGSCEGDKASQDGKFRFCIKSKPYPLYVGSELVEKPVAYKFALQFPA